MQRLTACGKVWKLGKTTILSQGLCFLSNTLSTLWELKLCAVIPIYTLIYNCVEITKTDRIPFDKSKLGCPKVKVCAASPVYMFNCVDITKTKTHTCHFLLHLPVWALVIDINMLTSRLELGRLCQIKHTAVLMSVFFSPLAVLGLQFSPASKLYGWLKMSCVEWTHKLLPNISSDSGFDGVFHKMLDWNLNFFLLPHNGREQHTNIHHALFTVSSHWYVSPSHIINHLFLECSAIETNQGIYTGRIYLITMFGHEIMAL